jgi:anion-transporting  ArsA/GET3 family ATPase
MRCAVPSLVSTRLVMVLGKGGVGRSTVAAALSMTLAHAGRRVLVVEVAAQERLPELFRAPGGDPIGYEPTPVFPGVDVISIDPLKALKEYLSLMLPMNLGGLLFDHGAFSGSPPPRRACARW